MTLGVTTSLHNVTRGHQLNPGTLVACGERAPTPTGCVARILHPPTRRDHKDAMTPHVIAKQWLGPLKGFGRVVLRGREMCHGSAELWQNDKIVATATGTFVIRKI